MTSEAIKRERSGLGLLLEGIRRKKRFTMQSLAREAGISATYISDLERGFDRRTGKVLKPSPTVLRLLADALGEREKQESHRIYGEFMAAVGYVAAESVKPRPQQEKPIEERVLEEDPNLRIQFHRVAQYWEEFTDEEKASVLAFLQFAGEQHRRRLASKEGGQRE